MDNGQLKSDLVSYTKENASLKEKASELEAKDQSSKIKELEEKLVEQQAKFEELEKEQEDVLVLMGKKKKHEVYIKCLSLSIR